MTKERLLAFAYLLAMSVQVAGAAIICFMVFEYAAAK